MCVCACVIKLYLAMSSVTMLRLCDKIVCGIVVVVVAAVVV